MLLQQILNGLLIGGIYALIAVGFAIIYSIMRYANFSYGGLIMVGAYIGYSVITKFHLSLIPGIILVSIVTALVNIIIERIGFYPIRIKKVPGIFTLVSSFIIAMILQNLILVIFGPGFQVLPQLVSTIPIITKPVFVSRLDFYTLIITLLSLIGLNLIVYRTKLGLAMRATSCNLKAALLMGINIDQISMIAFALAGALAGITGVLLAMKYSAYIQLSMLILPGFIACVIGGLGSLTGAVIGGITLGMIQVFSISYISSSFSPVLIYSFLIPILLIRPGGIFGRFVEEKA